MPDNTALIAACAALDAASDTYKAAGVAYNRAVDRLMAARAAFAKARDAYAIATARARRPRLPSLPSPPSRVIISHRTQD